MLLNQGVLLFGTQDDASCRLAVCSLKQYEFD